ncbi:MAG: DnaJ family domain-containing protein [Planctomycetota bacterium]
MSIDPTLIQRAIRRRAEKAIEQAMLEGKFDNLPGAGRPIAGLEQPWSEDQWVREWAVRERATNVEFNAALRAIRAAREAEAG